MGVEVDFLPADKHKSFLQDDSIILGVYIARDAQITQNKLAISLQHLKKNMKDEVDFLPADKFKIFLQIDTTILGVCMAGHAQLTQNDKFAIS